ncbi:MAG: hypothetical protein ACKVJK_01805 [Methylophagaceae bacterium]
MALSHVMNIISNSGLVAAGTGSGSGGGGGNLDSQTVTVGSYQQNNAGGSGAPSSATVYEGRFVYNTVNTYGSISDGTSNVYSGAAIEAVRYSWTTVYGTSNLWLVITGNNANSGWTTLTIGSTAYLRTNAFYAYDSGIFPNASAWYWNLSSDTTGANSPFGADGTTTTCVFT